MLWILLSLRRDKKSSGKEDTTILETQSQKKKKNNCYENIDAETIECGYDECFFSDVDIKP